MRVTQAFRVGARPGCRLPEEVRDIGEIGVDVGAQQEEIEKSACGEHRAKGGLASEDGLNRHIIDVMAAVVKSKRPFVKPVRLRILRKFGNPIVVPAACRVEPGLVGAAILGLDFAKDHRGD